MGEDKSLLPFGKFDTLVEYQYNKLSKIFQKVYISSKTNKFEFEANLIYDNQKDVSSPMVALQSILTHLNSEKVFIITVDVPLVDKDTIIELIRKSASNDIIIARDENKTHNLIGVFSKSILSQLNQLISTNNHKINCLITATDTVFIDFDKSSQFININTQENYTQALNYYKC